jgi:hypothetical protein
MTSALPPAPVGYRNGRSVHDTNLELGHHQIEV